jgi:hypothetical protein
LFILLLGLATLSRAGDRLAVCHFLALPKSGTASNTTGWIIADIAHIVHTTVRRLGN